MRELLWAFIDTFFQQKAYGCAGSSILISFINIDEVG